MSTTSQLRELRDFITDLIDDEPAKGVSKDEAAPKGETPDWIVEHAKNKQVRRELARQMRAQGIEPNGEPWEKAKALIAQGKTPAQAATQVAK